MLFAPDDYPAELIAVLTPPRLMELTPGTPNASARAQIQGLTQDKRFAGRQISDQRMTAACLSGLWLYHDFMDASHAISQDLHSAEGSYWHGILHRREPDFSNAKYWFRQVGSHAIHPQLAIDAMTIAEDSTAGKAVFASGGPWNAMRFVDLCQQATAGDAALVELCRRVQLREWQLLFDYCFRNGVAGEQ